MSGSVPRRARLVGMLVAGVTAAVVGTSSVANAAPLVTGTGFGDGLVNVIATGGGMTALTNCLTDAQDGAVDTYRSDCDKSYEDGALNLDDIWVQVFDALNPGEMLYEGIADINMMEGNTEELVSCLSGILEDGLDIEALCSGLTAPLEFMSVVIDQMLCGGTDMNQASAVGKEDRRLF